MAKLRVKPIVSAVRWRIMNFSVWFNDARPPMPTEIICSTRVGRSAESVTLKVRLGLALAVDSLD